MHSQVLYWIGSSDYHYQENTMTFVIKIIVYICSTVKCGTKFVPVTIIIKVSKLFYSIVNSGTKLIRVTGVSKHLYNSIKHGQVWYQISPNDHHYQIS